MKRIALALCLLATVAAAQTTPVGSFGHSYPNDTGTGTTSFKLVKLSGGNAVVTGSDLYGAIGICDGTNCGTSGNAYVVDVPGSQQACVFDNATTAGDTVTIGSSGACHDAGLGVRPSGSQCLGTVLSTNGSAGTYLMRWGCEGVQSRGWQFLCSQTSAASISGVTTETAALVCPLPAGTLSANGMVKITGRAAAPSGNGSNTCNFVIRVSPTAGGISGGFSASTGAVSNNRDGGFTAMFVNQGSLSANEISARFQFPANVTPGGSATGANNTAVTQYIGINAIPSSSTSDNCNYSELLVEFIQ